MKQRGRLVFWLFVSLAAAAGGYIWWDHARSEADESLESSLAGLDDPVVKPVSPVSAGSLTLQLKAGDVFPLIKTVEETITQNTPRGPIHSKTSIQLVLAIRVQEVQKDRTRLRVDYRRVRFVQDLPGERIDYDSASPPRDVPAEVQPYRGLVDNGFEFWIGPDNRILKLERFDEFLKRCVAHVPADRRAAVITRFIKTTGDEQVANFIDDSVGMLPYRDRAVKTGDTWTRKRQVLRPVPLALTQTCKLTRLDDGIAEIDVRGEIATSEVYGPSQQPQNGLRLTVTGGKTYGHCRIRRATGLPERSEIHRDYEMLVRYPDGRQFTQSKNSRTVIEVYSPQGGPRMIGLRTGE